MPEFTFNETEFEGDFGKATKLVTKDEPQYAATVAYWLVKHEKGHPLWSQYLLCGLRLDPFPNMPDPKLQFPEANRSVLLVALDPGFGPYTVERMNESPNPHFLLPVNVEWQFTGTDEECAKLVTASAWGVTHGVLWPETSDAPERVRNDWAKSLSETLKHFRGEAHETERKYV